MAIEREQFYVVAEIFEYEILSAKRTEMTTIDTVAYKKMQQVNILNLKIV
ncbi:MAG: hypothetical protein WBG70_20850 [Spirulinaceae cyanobacterium]